jgi:hypothetical protein
MKITLDHLKDNNTTLDDYSDLINNRSNSSGIYVIAKDLTTISSFQARLES